MTEIFRVLHWTWILALATPAQAAFAPLTSLSGCAGWGLVGRGGSPGCWAKLSLPGPALACVSQADWLRWLEDSEQGELCGSWQGRWKLSSPPLNPWPGSEVPTQTKITFRIFQVSKLPYAKSMGVLSYSRRWIERRREQLDEWLEPIDASGILRQLLTGTRPVAGALDLLAVLGFVHLLWASGIHFYALARLCDWALMRVACFLPQVPLSWLKASSLLASLLVCCAGWLLGGARAGALRPALVLGLKTGADACGLKLRKEAPLVLALLLDAWIGLWRHETLSDPGRWTYALACGGLLTARSAPGAALAAWAGIALLEAVRHGMIAWATPVLSLLTAPIFAGVIYPLLLAGSFLKLCGFELLAATIARACSGLSAELVSHLAVGAVVARSVWIVSQKALLGGVVLGALSLLARARVRAAALVGLLIARIALTSFSEARDGGPQNAPTQALRVEQLDVGQGDSALVVARVKGQDNYGLIDSGSEHSLGDREWLTLLARRGIRRLDWVALPHLDEDHSGGVKRLGRLLPVGCVATARGEIESDRGQIYKHDLEKLGIRLTDWSGPCVPFPTLAPLPAGAGKANQNMGAVFVPLASGGFYLSAGDADAGDEPRIGAWANRIASQLARPEPRVLKLSHHGSKTSSDPEFLKRVKPTRVWISVGVGNRYGHPSASVLALPELRTLPLSRTDENGALCAGRCR